MFEVQGSCILLPQKAPSCHGMPKHCWRVAAAWLWLLAATIPLRAASKPHFTVDIWDTEKGLPEMSVIALTQTHDGYLWVGAGAGLARFDGVRFKRYNAPDALGLCGSKIVRLFEDDSHNLLVGTENAGIFLLQPDGKLATVNLPGGANEGPVVNICKDTQHSVWFRMANGAVYRYADGQARGVVRDCTALILDDSGIIWVGSRRGSLLGLGPVSNSIPNSVVFPVPYELPAEHIDLLLASKRGGYWRLADHRIQKWNLDHLEHDYGPYPWRDVPILAACEDSDGRLIVGTYGDSVWWQSPEGEFNKVDGLPHGSIWTLTVDTEGTLWVGSNGGGLNRVKPQSFDVFEGTQSLTVQSVCADDNHGVWIGYNSERIDHWNGNSLLRFTNIWTRFSAQAVLADQLGHVWAGGSSESQEVQGGVLRTLIPPLLWIQANRFSLAPGPLYAETSALFTDHDRSVWVGAKTGLSHWDGQHWSLFTTRDGLSDNLVRAIAETPDGTLWVGTARGGLNFLRAGKWNNYRRQKDGLPSDNINSLYADPEGVLWVGTADGLGRLEHDKWTRYTAADGLASDETGYLVEDKEGYLWIGSNAGLTRVEKRKLNDYAHGIVTSIQCRIFAKADGLPSTECTSRSQPGACCARDGTLYFPTIQGLAVLQPARLRPNTNPPPVVIENVGINDRLVNPGAPIYAPPLQTLTVPAGSESVEISFSSLNLSAPEKGFFRYTMEPYQKTWTRRPGTIRSARYINLPHGHYTFRGQACNEDGIWNETGASLAITVLPEFWQTWWFLTACTLVLLGFIVSTVHYVSTQKLQRQLAAMRQHEAIERERARIARDLHDQLGANLTQVALLGEMAESDKEQPAEVEAHARQISHTARDTTRSLDEIVWTVNPSNDTLDGLINYLCKYAQEYLALANLRYRLEVPSQLPATPISPELRHNVVLAAKEAVNNVVKHSHATAAWLRLQLHPDRFVLEIEDNGSGLPAGAENKGRNGLKNMRRRMEDVGGQFEATPGAEGGTRIRLIAPLIG